ncbi:MULTISPECIES: hypothetical protein [Butyricimonas]|uniref:hypothetical protein n=1 Tax=Butyricimonas TaxID=574697 RepID=UPI0011DCFCB6|nr:MULTISPECIES: hypothetical protein [Butyricimonas]
MKQLVVLLLIFISILSCRRPSNKEGRHEILRIRNDSDKDLYYISNYCDSILPIDNFMKDAQTLVKSKSQKKEYELGGFEHDFRFCPYFIILFVDAELKETPYDTIRKYDMVLYRRSYTLEQLDSLNWTVTVP